LDYYTSGGTAGCPALLVEPSATNFAPNVNLMNQFDTPTVSGGVALTTGSTDFLAPDGTSGSINKYVGGIATSQSTRYAGAGVGVSASGTYRFSLFVKAGATNPLNFCAFSFGLFTAASGTTNSYFSLASGTALTAGASIEDYGNGWYRCISAPYTIAAGDLSGTVSFSLAEGNNDITWPASGALNLTAYTWGAQMEAGSVATSYIPTTTLAVTRNAEVINLSGAVSGCIGQTEGTIYVEIIPPTGGTGANLFLIGDTTANNFVFVGKSGANLQATIRSSNVSLFSNNSFALTGGAIKAALGYKSGDYALYANGSIVASGTTAFTFTSGLIRTGFASGFDFAAPTTVNKFNAAALYTTRLTNAELAALTTL
jgi:hypothetical protein